MRRSGGPGLAGERAYPGGVDIGWGPDLAGFADEVRTWLEEHLAGQFGRYRGRGLTGQDDIPVEVQLAWEAELARGGWLGLDYPAWIGGRECNLAQQSAFHAVYVEARAPGRLPNMGLTLLGPTLMAFGSPEQQRRFVPPILAADELWCQGYSEPDAGSDLANVATRAALSDGRWVINGQKVWTSLAQHADWIFVLARTAEGSSPTAEGSARTAEGSSPTAAGPARTAGGSARHAGLSYLLVPMDQPGIEVRPIVQINGADDFNHVFFTDAATDEDLVVGGAGNGWRVAMGTLGFERGASTLGQQIGFRAELDDLMAEARSAGRWDDPAVRDELMRSYVELEIMGYNHLRMLTALAHDGLPGPEQSIGKLWWATWHRRLGELAMLVRGPAGMVAADGARDGGGGIGYRLDRWQRTFLFSRAHTIYGGSNQIQRNVIAERVLGLPRGPR